MFIPITMHNATTLFDTPTHTTFIICVHVYTIHVYTCTMYMYVYMYMYILQVIYIHTSKYGTREQGYKIDILH